MSATFAANLIADYMQWQFTEVELAKMTPLYLGQIVAALAP
jgi:hypothetical protein